MMESKYPEKDLRRKLELNFNKYDWEKIFRYAADLAKAYEGFNSEDVTDKMVKIRELRRTVRRTMRSEE